MFDIVIASEKPSITCELAPYLLRRYPGASTLVFNMGLGGPLRFSFPRGGEYSDYPKVSGPEYQYTPPAYTHAHSLAEYAEVERTNFRCNWNKPSLEAEALLSATQNAKRFVYVADPNSSSAHGYLRFLQFAGVADGLAKTDAYIICSLVDETLDKTFNQGSTDESVEHLRLLAGQGEVKRYFEWNWNQNALVVMRPPLKATGVSADAVISKYELQLLYFLARNPEGPAVPGAAVPNERYTQAPVQPVSWTEGRLVQVMRKWTGSGKYAQAFLGSSASRDTIIQHLYDKEYIARAPETKRVGVTRRGREFLNLLHPDCEDPDLPARLDIWMERGLEKSQAAIDRYIRTFFGKQIRFYGRNHNNP